MRGCAALATMYFNSDSIILIKYFSQRGVSVSKNLNIFWQKTRKEQRIQKEITNDKIELNEKLQREQIHLELQLM